MDRRAFLRSSCMGCAAAALGAGALSLSGCASLPVVRVDGEGTTAHVPLSAFAAGDRVLLRQARLPFDILVLRTPEGTYRSLYLQCTHRDQPVSATSNGLYCPSHGSRYALDGSVLVGPATTPLHSFHTTVDGDHLLIDLKS